MDPESEREMEPDTERWRHRERERVVGVCGERERQRSFPTACCPAWLRVGLWGKENERMGTMSRLSPSCWPGALVMVASVM